MGAGRVLGWLLTRGPTSGNEGTLLAMSQSLDCVQSEALVGYRARVTRLSMVAARVSYLHRPQLGNDRQRGALPRCPVRSLM